MNEIALVIALIFGGQFLGSFLGLLKRPSNAMICVSLAFAASIMLGVSVFQLLPESLMFAPPALVIFSFILGALLLWLAGRLMHHVIPDLGKGKSSMKRSVALLTTGMALHNFPEGLAMGVAFALRPDLGIAIAVALTLHNIPENLAVAVPIYGLVKKRRKSLTIVSATLFSELLGFLLGYFALKDMSLPLIGAALALAAGFMIYLSITELLPAARIHQHKSGCMWAIFAGFVTVLLITLFLNP